TSYVVYTSSTMDTTPGQPDGGSVGCLSCHDGTVAFDSLVNAPGPGGVAGYTVSGSENATFLNNPSFSLNYSFEIFGFVLDKPTTMVVVANAFGNPAGLIGTDLSNDHPISMVYPTAGQDPAFNQPPGTPGSAREFPNGIRTFESDKVQCASCHEPHLSDTAAEAKELRPFLRVNNTGSAVCLTCHIK
ncbi:MAG: cytochrome c3 family protein, partial [Deltaproteobacteria bacterium]|nr:cytochrome c3 family protein [Deltaproteobacteria bacterium]